jgi:hypothetical protein
VTALSAGGLAPTFGGVGEYDDEQAKPRKLSDRDPLLADPGPGVPTPPAEVSELPRRQPGQALTDALADPSPIPVRFRQPNRLRERYDRIAARHRLIVDKAGSDVSLEVTAVLLRCSCGTGLPGTTVANTETDADAGLSNSYLDAWKRLQILHHRLDALLAEGHGWTPPPPA